MSRLYTSSFTVSHNEHLTCTSDVRLHFFVILFIKTNYITCWSTIALTDWVTCTIHTLYFHSYKYYTRTDANIECVLPQIHTFTSTEVLKLNTFNSTYQTWLCLVYTSGLMLGYLSEYLPVTSIWRPISCCIYCVCVCTWSGASVCRRRTSRPLFPRSLVSLWSLCCCLGLGLHLHSGLKQLRHFCKKRGRAGFLLFGFMTWLRLSSQRSSRQEGKQIKFPKLTLLSGRCKTSVWIEDTFQWILKRLSPPSTHPSAFIFTQYNRRDEVTGNFL